MSQIIPSGKGFIETECDFTHNGRTFTAGGAFLGTRATDGKLAGIVYESQKTGEVTSWDGSIRIPAKYGHSWRGAWGDRRTAVHFEYEGVRFSGILYSGKYDDSQIIRFKEVG